MSVNKKQVQAVRGNLNELASVIESLSYQEPPSIADLPDRSISGDKIRGGKIAQFASLGIKDDSTQLVVTVNNDGLFTDNIAVKRILNDIAVNGNLTVDGEITATKLHVNELTADIRNERSTPLEFVATETDTIYGKGLQWKSNEPTKQFVLRPNPDRYFSSENVDIARDKGYFIGNIPVLTENELGSTITQSNLNKVGILIDLAVQGDFKIDEFLFWNSDSMRLGIGTEEPNGMLSIATLESEFIINPEGKNLRIGTYTNDTIDVITDDKVRLQITSSGHIHLGKKDSTDGRVTVNGKIGVNVNNIKDDTDLETAGPVRFQSKKFEVSNQEPKQGVYSKGDIVWSDDPKPTGYVGWICIKDGTPGIWKPFGQIGA